MKRYFGAYLFILPAMTFLAVFVLLPFVQVIRLSFTDYDLIEDPVFIGMDNYRELLSDSIFHVSLVNTVLYTLGSVALGLTMAFLVARLLLLKLRGIDFFRVACFTPAITSTVVGAMIFLWLLDYDLGLLNYFLESIGKEKIEWLISTRWALPSIILVGAWRGVAYNIPIYLAGMASIPDSYYEASRIEGARWYHELFLITLPLMRPIVFFTVLMAILGSFQVVAEVDVLTDGGPMNSTMVVLKYIFLQGFSYNRLGYAACISVFLFLILLILTYFNVRKDLGQGDKE